MLRQQAVKGLALRGQQTRDGAQQLGRSTELDIAIGLYRQK